MNEFISGGVPFVCFPHFGDQGDNTDLAVEQKFGISLIDTNKGRGPGKIDKEHTNPLFTAKDVEKAFNEILNNPSYMTNILKVKALSDIQGGRELAAKTVENTF